MQDENVLLALFPKFCMPAISYINSGYRMSDDKDNEANHMCYWG